MNDCLNRDPMPSRRIGGNHTGVLCCIGALACSAFCSTVQADDFSLVANRPSLNILRLLQKPVSANGDLLPDNEPAPFSISQGLSYERGPVGQYSGTAPYKVSYNPGRWYFEVSGDGYTRSRVKSGTVHGFGDLSLVSNYTYGYGLMDDKTHNKYSLTPEIAIVIPGQSAVGSTASSQIGALTWTMNEQPWAWSVKGAIGRDSNSVAEKSRYAGSGSAMVQYTDHRHPDDVLSLTVKRSLQPGAEATTDLKAELDFLLFPALQKHGKWGGALTLAHRLAGERSDSLGFEVAYGF